MGEDAFDRMEKRMARLERIMDEMLEEALVPSWSVADHTLEPLCDLENLEDEIVITADLPCVRAKEDLEIHCTGTSLDIEARMCHPVSFRKWGTIQREADFECFRKKIPLPAEVEPEGAKASLKGGILKIRLPKRRGRHRIRIL
jgi:HSP20 family molecular chaperone IbpA